MVGLGFDKRQETRGGAMCALRLGLWKVRNSFIFKGERWVASDMVKFVFNFMVELEHTCSNQWSLTHDLVATPALPPWCRPPVGLLKLNIDGGYFSQE